MDATAKYKGRALRTTKCLQTHVRQGGIRTGYGEILAYRISASTQKKQCDFPLSFGKTKNKISKDNSSAW